MEKEKPKLGVLTKKLVIWLRFKKSTKPDLKKRFPCILETLLDSFLRKLEEMCQACEEEEITLEKLANKELDLDFCHFDSNIVNLDKELQGLLDRFRGK